MQYVSFGKTGEQVSRLGFGMMRLPVVKAEDGKEHIDRGEAIRMVRHAVDRGVNYVDTAYGYHHKESEVVTGLALKDGYRERVLLASKLPQWLVERESDMDRLLDDQLRKLDVSTLDFYLLHALNGEAFDKLRRLHYPAFLERAKRDGRIRHAGFSFHDDKAAFLRIIDDYDWAMAQIQFNYLDDENQATLDGLLYAQEKGIPIVVMEPLRGGALAEPPEEIRRMMRENRRGFSPVEWAFRYAGDFSGVATILSGMSTMEQVEDNLRVFDRVVPGSLDQADHAFLKSVKQAYLARIKIGCTACNYCQPCPEGVQIPRIFEAWNEAYMLSRPASLAWEYANIIKEQGDGARCVACGQCESVCPQQLPIIASLRQVDLEARRA